ncbi:GNAT family N-acetyltransferase [Fictibacillus sp. WQ 8-8]|uniref:GNAT family N-acetyltransferase n=1 Tax=Fictibacillus sp. WQ 8-8 TaxID=2938788 RepID=UPI00210ECA44|nr:GNAT family N-acetyltransferase [Fictibacillus sp. WQ 8-8]MCQ6264139.1 GNAT family N-acetyltransferase [Fictibacillus sp. WQ 8-8]
MDSVQTLVTDRLILRMFDEEKDAENYARVLGQDEVGRYLPKRGAYSPEEAMRMMAFFIKGWEDRGFGTFAVQMKDGELIGHCGLNYVKDLDEVELLYAFSRESWGQGFAAEAAAACVKAVFERLHLNRLIGLAMPANQGSGKVLKKVGMAWEKDISLWNMELQYFSMTAEDYWRPKKDL